MDWSNEKVMEFIENYEAEPILWNPQDPCYKKKHLIHEAWVRIKNNLSWSTSVDDLKKKKASLMAYYRTHQNKYKKSVKSGASADDIYKSNWFAFAALNSFLQPIYASEETIHAQIEENSEYKIDHSDSDEGNPEQEHSPKRPCRVKRKIHYSPEKTQDAFVNVKDNADEYGMFAQLIAGKIRKIMNPNTRDILMNDIQNMVFRACMVDRAGQNSVKIPSPSSPLYLTSLFSSSQTYQSKHHSSPSPSPQTTYLSPPPPSPPQSPKHSPSTPSASQSPETHLLPDPLQSSYQSKPILLKKGSARQIMISESGRLSFIKVLNGKSKIKVETDKPGKSKK